MKTLHRRNRLRLLAVAGVAAAIGTVPGTQTAIAAPPGPAAARGDADVAAAVPADVRSFQKDLKDVTPGPGFVPASAYLAHGTQTYTCTAVGQWPTSGSVPEATLVRVGRPGDTVHHYAGPRWEAKDGSIVHGVVPPRRQVARSGTIPWLLLDVTHEGSPGALTPVTNVSRILTSGGLPPSGTCVPGSITSPEYRAVYVFWVPTRRS